MSSLPILAVDFDGCLHSYTSGWKGIDIAFDPPVTGAIEWLLAATRHWRVNIWSSRSAEARGIAAMQTYIHGYAHQILGPEEAKTLMDALEWPTSKPPAMLTIDDRAITFGGDWGALDPKKLRAFVPWPRLEVKDSMPCPHCGRSGWRLPWYQTTQDNDEGGDPTTAELLKPRGNGGVVSPDICYDMLTISGKFVVALDTITGWSQQERDEVYDWAARVHLHASDNEDVLVPPLPAVLAERA